MTEPQLHPFYVTFGQMYRHEEHPYWPGANPDGWLRVLAPDEEAARFLVRSFIGLKWAMMYDHVRFDEANAQRQYYPKGELAWVATDGGIGAAAGVGAPTPRFGEHHPEYYGRESNEVVAVRIEGTLKHGSDADAIEQLGYEVEYYHPGCWLEGVQSWSAVTELDREVRAFELNWAEPCECPVCEVSIT